MDCATWSSLYLSITYHKWHLTTLFRVRESWSHQKYHISGVRLNILHLISFYSLCIRLRAFVCRGSRKKRKKLGHSWRFGIFYTPTKILYLLWLPCKWVNQIWLKLSYKTLHTSGWHFKYKINLNTCSTFMLYVEL